MRRHKLIQFWKMQLLWEGLPENVMKCLFDHAGVLNDNLFIAATRVAVEKEIPERLLNVRIKFITEIQGLPRLDLLLFQQWKKIVAFNIQELSIPIRKPKKYSGYVRSPSSVGGKRRTGGRPEPGTFEWSSISEIDYYTALTVGEFIGESLVIVLPDDASN
jgi:hypothetical protein